MTEPTMSRMRVMLATDDSAPARIAEDWIARLRFSASPLVEVVCVAGRGITRLGWGMQTYRASVREAVEGLRQAELRAAQRIANQAGERLQAAGLTVHAWARQGDCAEELLAMIAGDQPDLVVVGPRGRSGLAAAILGSVTHSLVAHAETAVLVARASDQDQGRLPEHTLVLADGSRSAEAAISWLLRVGWLVGSRVTVLGLLGERAGLDHDEPALVEDIDRLVREDATAALDRVALPLVGEAASLQVDLRGGHPLETALAAGEELGADLIAVARPHRRPGHDPFAEKVARHASRSVLLVPIP